MGPLEGTLVLELSDQQVGSIAGMLLSDYGATVIKVNPPGNDLNRWKPGFRVWDRGKKSLLLELESGEGQGVFYRLLKNADILLQALPIGEVERLGIDYGTLHNRFPKLVYCSITGYDANTPDWGRPAYDGLIQAKSGVMVGGSWDAKNQGGHRVGPKYMGFAAPSYATSFNACLGLLTALFVRNSSDIGQHVQTSLYGGVMSMSRWGWADNPGPAPSPARGLYGIWECEDKEWIWTHTGARGSFDRFMDVFGLRQYKSTIENPLDWSSNLTEELRGGVRKIICTKPRSDWVSLFNAADCPNQAALHPGVSFEDDQVHSVEMVISVDDKELGLVQQVGVPIKFEKSPGSVQGPSPLPGENTVEILKLIGLNKLEIDSLNQNSIVGFPD